MDEPVPGYPKRPVPRDEDAANALKKRTSTHLYNGRPQWLADAHEAFDAAVAEAYGWPSDISDEEVLRELLALNGGGGSMWDGRVIRTLPGRSLRGCRQPLVLARPVRYRLPSPGLMYSARPSASGVLRQLPPEHRRPV